MTRDISSEAKPCPMCGSKRIYMDEPNYEMTHYLMASHIEKLWML